MNYKPKLISFYRNSFFFKWGVEIKYWRWLIRFCQYKEIDTPLPLCTFDKNTWSYKWCFQFTLKTIVLRVNSYQYGHIPEVFTKQHVKNMQGVGYTQNEIDEILSRKVE
jgi:hypothetical protein